MHAILLQKGTCSQSRALFKFTEISDNISETVQDTDMVAWSSCLYSPATEHHRAPWPVLISRPAEGRRLSWPELLLILSVRMQVTEI